ncbi:UDP-N-acetylmuramoyl-tripeptide--D-alanyl-D-alanine ligase [Neiella marina]|uniref:UDP-N-acetylmuramoyl-tripeptide--D-alanyl-D-alanine ligase n=1 Tax=Neiella holothuriorum TaxID=2870530 RepID=A0ABS7EB16_9GAMM|nr:UDP-N-acetylmuramoyl-tripeptide--D-alanyl-D-alanine ligase [Neiella holothuriorum]MBW8189531.1 UDP-N-acetylmuramoyl-tripeptide--D-alanyl-D-alanine ligase [Neiella holothuriorum]
MIELMLKDICHAVAGTLVGDDKSINSVTTDTRQVESGALFVALVGERFDAHDFVDQAQQAGAGALLVSRQVKSSLPQIVVNDSKLALGDLGRLIAERCQTKNIAVTGSAGKTTVKEMTAAILGRHHQVLATDGNFNNDIGVPLTLLRLNHQVTHAVIELGANHAGEIAYTTDLVKPSIAMITNIGSAHLEGFGSEQGIADAKFEIFSGLPPQGVAIFDLHGKYTAQWQNKLQGKQVITWSRQADLRAQVRASHIELEQDSSQFVLTIGHESIDMCLPMAGLHNIDNALAASAAAYAAGVGIVEIATVLEAGVFVKGRLNSTALTEQLTVIDDTYNANLASVKAAVDVLANCQQEKTVLILGDMGELGGWARQHHHDAGSYAREQGVQALFTLGSLSEVAQQGFASSASHGEHFYELDALMAALTEWISQQQQPLRVLVKGSRGAAMERVIDRLQQWLRSEEELSC